MRNPITLAPLLLAFSSVLLPGRVGVADDERTLSVSGDGTVTAPPDMATVEAGIVTEAEEAQAALDANNRTMRQILQTLKEQGVAEKHIRTVQIDLSPVHERDERGRREERIVAYRARNEVRVEVRELPRLGAVLDALVSAGANTISSVSLGVAEPDSPLNEARRRAVADAQSRARVYAEAAGVDLGAVRSIREGGAAIPQPRQMALAQEAARSVPVATGELEFRATVHMVFGLSRDTEVDRPEVVEPVDIEVEEDVEPVDEVPTKRNE